MILARLRVPGTVTGSLTRSPSLRVTGSQSEWATGKSESRSPADRARRPRLAWFAGADVLAGTLHRKFRDKLTPRAESVVTRRRTGRGLGR